MTDPKIIHPIANTFLDFAKAHPEVKFEIRQDGGPLTLQTPYAVSDASAHLTPLQQQVMSRGGTIGGAELDQYLRFSTPKDETIPSVKIFTDDGATLHPDAWWEGRNGPQEKAHRPIVQISALDLSKAGAKKLLGELNTMLQEKGLVGTFKRTTLHDFTQHEAPGVSLIAHPNAIILTVRTGDVTEQPALVV